ncbi:hypothetical protein AX16_008961 [Volvariella volvacea WC 439]|nr:hypothetical protein AX16_008961 [Volvariella volvacea WC 439]
MDAYCPQMELPGIGLNFEDVTDVFLQASRGMNPSQVILIDGLTLQDAMSAYQIGEPQLDPGLILDEEKNRPPFNPMTPLLPEEICWIIDRACAYEMEWLKGNHLPHTLFTLLYVHHLPQFDPIILDPITISYNQDPARPTGLVTVVLRSAILSLLKSCDLVWRQLNRSGVQDAEDWQSEKCEVSLLEGVPVDFILSKLDEAVIWLMRPNNTNLPWRNALVTRIRLRKTLLQMFNSHILRDSTALQSLIDFAQYQIQLIRPTDPPTPPPNSAALLVFDVNISRRLSTFVPVRVIPLPDQQKVWDAYIALLDGWAEVRKLALTKSITTWNIVGNLQNWMSTSETRLPYLRALSQLAFLDGGQILNAYSFSWMVDRFFFETLGVSFAHIIAIMKNCWVHAGSPNTFKLERELQRVLPLHIRSQWYNPPRRRRFFMKSLVDWHNLYDIISSLVDSLELSLVPPEEANIIKNLPNVILIWRLSLIREVVLSGFQMELYAPEERPFAYWYTSVVINKHLECLDDLTNVIPHNSTAYQEMQFQSQFLTSLGALSTGCFIVSSPLLMRSHPSERIRTNFFKRYKWAFDPAYDNIEQEVVCQPEMHEFMTAFSNLHTSTTDSAYPSEHIELAKMPLSQLIDAQSVGMNGSANGGGFIPPLAFGWADKWSSWRTELLRSLLKVCNDSLAGLPSQASEVCGFDPRRMLRWDASVHPWFPSVVRDDH